MKVQQGRRFIFILIIPKCSEHGRGTSYLPSSSCRPHSPLYRAMQTHTHSQTISIHSHLPHHNPTLQHLRHFPLHNHHSFHHLPLSPQSRHTIFQSQPSIREHSHQHSKPPRIPSLHLQNPHHQSPHLWLVLFPFTHRCIQTQNPRLLFLHL